MPGQPGENNRSNLSLRTTHRSTAAIACAWLRKNVFQPCDPGPLPWGVYFKTADWAASNPSISSSPWTRGRALGRVFPAHLPNELTQPPIETFGRPALFRDFQGQNALKPARCQRRMASGSTPGATPSWLGQSQLIQTNKRPSQPPQPKAGRRSPQSDAQLMAWEQVFGLKPAARLEQVDEQRPERITGP